MMEIKSAEFVTSMADYGPFTGKGLPQIAVAGKSNVGKSTLINRLCRRNKLARTSSTPGKTRLLNVFLLNGEFHLVDLPGYGFAKVDKQEKQRWGKMMQDYFAKADELRHVLCLVDIRHEPTEDDKQMNRFLRETEIPFTVIATKADKISRGARSKYLLGDHLLQRRRRNGQGRSAEAAGRDPTPVRSISFAFFPKDSFFLLHTGTFGSIIHVRGSRDAFGAKVEENSTKVEGEGQKFPLFHMQVLNEC